MVNVREKELAWYYIHWQKYGNADSISKDEIYKLIELGQDNCVDELWELIEKYDIKYQDWIWRALAFGWGYESFAYELDWRLKMEPFYIEFVMDDVDKYLKWQKEVERKGYNITGKMKWEIEMIRKELEDKYIKEGADIEVDGTWVKAKSIYSKGKENKEVSGHIASFKIDYNWRSMLPYRREIY
jgi:hypothetical protein